MSERRIIIAGGGTGGHLFPGLALAEELRGRGIAVTFVGTARGLEAKVVPTAGYPLELIDVAGLKGKGLGSTLRSLFRLPLSLWQSLRLVRKLRPLAAIGVGGYASGPMVLTAALCGIPTAILEQNSIPGITNRILSRVVRSVVIAFTSSSRFFPSKKLLPLGNPIRAAVIAEGRKQLSASTGATTPTSIDPPTRVLVLGGSQGAHAVNELVSAAVAHWAAQPSGKEQLVTRLRLRHQTGTADCEAMTRRYAELGLGDGIVQVDAFISDMGSAYAQCDLVVGRAGATTLAELTAIGKPALLIPFPQAADDHQTENARSLVAAGAAELLPQAATTAAELSSRLQALSDGEPGRARLVTMADASRKLGRPDAARDIADHVLKLLEKA